ncbi:hypothetical protein Tco_1443560, partial [Tanacetum coccineum]
KTKSAGDGLNSVQTDTGQEGISPAEGEKNTHHATISQLFQRKLAKDAKKANLKQTTTKTQPTFQSPFSPSPSSSSSQTEGDPIKKDKIKETMSSKDGEEEETVSDSEDEYANPADSMVESFKKRKVKKFDFVTEGGEHVHLTAEKIKEQKRIEESLKADLAKHNKERVKELIDLMGYDIVVTQACPNQKGKGWKTIYKQMKPKMDFLHQAEVELKIDFNKPLKEQDPLDELNSLASNKRK